MPEFPFFGGSKIVISRFSKSCKSVEISRCIKILIIFLLLVLSGCDNEMFVVCVFPLDKK